MNPLNSRSSKVALAVFALWGLLASASPADARSLAGVFKSSTIDGVGRPPVTRRRAMGAAWIYPSIVFAGVRR